MVNGSEDGIESRITQAVEATIRETMAGLKLVERLDSQATQIENISERLDSQEECLKRLKRERENGIALF